METGTELEAARQASLDLLVDTYLHAFRAADVETALSTLAEDVELDLVGSTPSSIRGKEAVRANHLEEFANTMHERDLPLRRLYGPGFVADELVWEGRVTGRVGPLIGNGRRVSRRVLRIFEVRGGLITRQSVYTDFAALARQLA
jgi:ketosteroid isomerase-like protein